MTLGNRYTVMSETHTCGQSANLTISKTEAEDCINEQRFNPKPCYAPLSFTSRRIPGKEGPALLREPYADACCIIVAADRDAAPGLTMGNAGKGDFTLVLRLVPPPIAPPVAAPDIDRNDGGGLAGRDGCPNDEPDGVACFSICRSLASIFAILSSVLARRLICVSSRIVTTPLTHQTCRGLHS